MFRALLALVLTMVLTHSMPVSAAQATADYNLRAAITHGDVAGVEEAITEGADLNGPNRPLHSVFSVAFYGKQALNGAIAKLLMHNGAEVTTPDQEGKTPLYLLSILPREVAGSGALDLAKLIVERGGRVDAVTDEGWTPLMAAASRGSHDMVHFFVAKGANVELTNASGETALSWAVRADPARVSLADKLKTIQVLLDHGASPLHMGNSGATPLSLARESGSPRLFDALQRKVTDSTPADTTAAKAAPVFASLPATGNPQAELWIAAAAGDPEGVRKALTRGAEIEIRDQKKRTALLMALEKADENNAAAAKTLIDLGANITASAGNNVQPIHRAAANAGSLCSTTGKCTPATNPFFGLIDLLEEKGADLRACSEDTSSRGNVGGTPLQIAVQDLSVPLVEFLLPKMHRKTLSQQCQGRTALVAALGAQAYAAAQRQAAQNTAKGEGERGTATPAAVTESPEAAAKRKRIVSILVSKGAEVNQRDRAFGLSPLQVARVLQNEEITNILVEAGAKDGSADGQ